MLYLDATVFLYPILYSGPKSDEAKKILRAVSDGLRPACTASLTYDEVVWKVIKHFGRAKGLEAAEAFLAFPNLRIVSVSAEHLAGAKDLMLRYGALDPRDSIHASVAMAVGAKEIVTDDSDFDGVTELRRLPLEQAKPKRASP